MNKIIFITLIFSLLQSQESGILSKRNRPVLSISGSHYSLLNEADNFQNNSFTNWRLDYKTKFPFELWFNSSDNLASYGLSYVLNAKKWGLSLFFENSIRNSKDLNIEKHLLIDSKKFGWIINFKQKNRLYFKFTNCIKGHRLILAGNSESEENIDKEDFITLGNIFLVKKIVVGYSISFNAKDFLMLDLKDGIFNILLGYKFKFK